MSDDQHDQMTSKDEDALALSAVRAERRYWLAIAIYVIAASFVFVVVSASLSMYPLIADLQGVKPSLRLRISSDLSPQSAIGAFGVLATIIIALQVAVRPRCRLGFRTHG